MKDQQKKKRLPMREIKSHLTIHLRSGERGIKHFKQAGAALDAAINLGLPVGTPVKLADGRVFELEDQFEGKNTAFSAKKFDRYKLKEVKPLPVRPTKKGGEG